MKTQIIAVVVGILVIAGIMVVNAIQDEPAKETSTDSKPDCALSYGKQCTEKNNCGREECGIEKTGSCGCRQ